MLEQKTVARGLKEEVGTRTGGRGYKRRQGFNRRHGLKEEAGI
jgi:hypothetical protein